MSTVKDHILKGALVGAVLNAIINGAIYWFQVKDQLSVLVTDDAISSKEHTLFAGAVPLATTLAFILSSIAYFTTKKEGKPRYFPSVFLLSLKNAVFAFGAVTIFALIFQRVMGSVSVTPGVATLITAFVAGIVSALVDYNTKMELNNRSRDL